MRNALFASAVGLAVLGACTPAGGSSQQAAGADPQCFKRSSEAIGGPFQLTSSDGKAMTEKDFAGRKALVYFGYTYCPDACPLMMFNLGKAMQSVPADRQPATIFISVDPERDTPGKLTQFIGLNGFPKDIVGLTGTPEQLAQVNAAFRTTFGKDEADGSDTGGAAGYLVSHSAILYLMDANWKLQTFFMEDEPPRQIASCLAALD